MGSEVITWTVVETGDGHGGRCMMLKTRSLQAEFEDRIIKVQAKDVYNTMIRLADKYNSYDIEFNEG